MVVTYDNINTTESIGASVNTALKGGAQFTAKVVDVSLGTDMGTTDLAAVLIVLALAVGILGYIVKGKTRTEALF